MKFTYPPDFSGLDPETGEGWSPKKVVKILGLKAVNDPDQIKGNIFAFFYGFRKAITCCIYL